MVGRGALIKPWIFQEFQQQQTWEPDLSDRVAVYRRLVGYMKDHFGDDEMGRKKTWNFLPWHFDFLRRYVSLPEDKYGTETSPLIQMRMEPDNHYHDDRPPLEILLAHRSKRAHEQISALLWESSSDQDAVSKLASFAESPEFEEIQTTEDKQEEEETKELANIRNDGRRKEWRKKRAAKPKRTPEEIVAIRAERAAKKARLALEAENSKASS